MSIPLDLGPHESLKVCHRLRHVHGCPSPERQAIPCHQLQSEQLIFLHDPVVLPDPLRALHSMEPLLQCSLGMHCFQHLRYILVLDRQLILLEVSADPCHPHLLLPSFDDVVLNTCCLVILNIRNLLAHETVGLHLRLMGNIVSFHDPLEVALLPSKEEVVILIVRKGLEEFVTQIVDFLVSLLLSSGFLDLEEALHVHALLEDSLRADEKGLLLLDAMPPGAKDKPLLAVEVLLEVAPRHHADKVIGPPFLELLPVLQPDHLRLRILSLMLQLTKRVINSLLLFILLDEHLPPPFVHVVTLRI